MSYIKVRVDILKMACEDAVRDINSRRDRELKDTINKYLQKKTRFRKRPKYASEEQVIETLKNSMIYYDIVNAYHYQKLKAAEILDILDCHEGDVMELTFEDFKYVETYYKHFLKEQK